VVDAHFSTSKVAPPSYFEGSASEIPLGFYSKGDPRERGITPIDVDSKNGAEWVTALYKSLTVSEKQTKSLESKINSYFPGDPKTERALPTLSVRSCLDLYFQARKFPAGTEIMMTGMNIPDMVRIV